MVINSIKGSDPRCSNCSRPLSDPVSVKNGIGPICAAKLLRVQSLDKWILLEAPKD